MRFLLSCIVLLIIPSLCSAPDAARPMLGYTPDQAISQRALEERFDGFLSADRVWEWIRILSARPHHVGSAYGKMNADLMAERLRSWGYETQIETFYVLFPTPRLRVLEMLAPVPFRAALSEPPIKGDASSAYVEEQLPVYHAYSTDGDVTGEVVYVNHGLRSDYETLKMYGIEVRGKIVIAREGGSYRGAKPKIAAEQGAIGCIVYSDPSSDGYYWGDVYPKGGWRNEDSAQRGSVLDYTEHNGDALTPFVPAFKDAKRISRSEAGGITKIPVLPISYKDALPILRSLNGPMAPEEWRGNLPIPYHIGPGPWQLHLKLEFNWDISPVYNVIARMSGSEYPDQWVIRGNHHDAWVYGANDPVSGIAAVLEEAYAVAQLAKTGWRPKRTLIYAAWDGEEGGLLGSTEWVEAHIKELQQKAVAYINSDSNARGFFYFQGSSTLEKLVNQVAADVEDPEKHISVQQRTRAYLIQTAADPSEARERADLRILPAGSGSDYSTFLQHAGIASLDVSFGNEDEYGQYHSIYDTFDHYKRFVDPSFEYGVALAKAGGRCMLRLANAEVLPFEFTGFADNVSRFIKRIRQFTDQRREEIAERNQKIAEKSYEAYFDPMSKFVVPSPEDPIPDLDFAPLLQAANALPKSAQQYQIAYDQWMKTLLTPSNATDVNSILMHMEQSLTRKEGLPGRPWFTHQLIAPTADAVYGAGTLPGIRAAIDRKDWALAKQQIGVVAETLEKFRQDIDRATAALNGAQASHPH